MAKVTLQAGDFSTKVDILEVHTRLGTLGEEEGKSLGPHKMDVPCKWEDLGGTETTEVNRETAFGKAKATFRYNAAKDFHEKLVVRRKGKDYDIENISEVPEPRNMYIVLSLKRHD